MPEWHIFDRIDELEKLYLEQSDDLKGARSIANDSLVTGLLALVLTVVAIKTGRPTSKAIDELISIIERAKISQTIKTRLIETVQKLK